MNIILVKDKFSQYKLIGSKSNDEDIRFNSLFNSNFRNFYTLQDTYYKNIDSLNVTHNEMIRQQLIIENNSLEKQINQSKKESFRTWLDISKNNPSSYILPQYIGFLLQREYISLDSIKMILSNLDNNVKVGLYGRKLTEAIRIQENTQVGAYAPDFKAIDINNEPITLSQFRGKKVVLIEFWASWCSPCRSGFPFLIKLNTKYKSKGFEIIAISNYDTNRDTWKSAIMQEKIENWYHLATKFLKDSAINKDIMLDYPSGPIPLSFLIDKSGKIIGSWKGHTLENEKELEDRLVESLK